MDPGISLGSLLTGKPWVEVAPIFCYGGRSAPGQDLPTMTLSSILIFLIIGAVAGWLAGILIKGRGFGLIGDILVGIVGAFIGGFVLTFFGLASLIGAGVISAILVATIGAVILLSVITLLKKL